jgi:hypothetical protein
MAEEFAPLAIAPDATGCPGVSDLGKDLKNEKWIPINRDLGAIGYLAWSHDIGSVSFDTSLSKEPGYYRLRIRDMKIKRLVNFKKIRLFSGQFGGSGTGLGPGDVSLFPRDISTQEIYAFDLAFAMTVPFPLARR